MRLSNGNIASFTSIEAQLEIESGKKRYINPKIENELIEFIRKMYTFPDMAPMATIGDENVDLCLSGAA